MFSNYLKTAWRAISRHKIYSIINITGLALGISICIVIYLIVSYELGFDRFHPFSSSIYRVTGQVTENTGNKLAFARLPMALVAKARSDARGIKLLAGITPWNANITIPVAEEAQHFDSHENGGLFVTTAVTEPGWFGIFTYEWVAGNPASALEQPNTVVITASRAKKYFGSMPPNQLLGRKIIYQDSLVTTITGIVNDWQSNTDLPFSDFISAATLHTSFLKNSIATDGWGQRSMNTWIFAKLAKNMQANAIDTQLQQIIKTHAGSSIRLLPRLEPLSAIHFNQAIIENPIKTAHLPTIYSLVIIAVFILLLAVVNFINLSTAQSYYRSREVAIHKVMGSSTGKLMLRFLTETFIVTIFSVLLAVLMVQPLLTLFNSFIPAGLRFHLTDKSLLLFLLSITTVTAVLAGLYPAKILSNFTPATSLKGKPAAAGTENWWMRKGLVVFQFTVSFLFITGAIVIASQLKYTREKDPGFRKEAVLTIETPRGDSLSKIAVLYRRLQQLAGINNIALQWVAPMTDNTRGMQLKYNTTDINEIGVTQVDGNENFIPLYGIKILAGRNLLPADSVKEFVISETLSRAIGDSLPEASIGRVLFWNDKPYPIVGVVADFHTKSFHDAITPLCIINRRDRMGTIALQLSQTGKDKVSTKEILAKAETAFKQIYPSGSFNYRFFDESLEMLYEKDRQTAVLINTAMAITVFISCIGLFGLVLFTAGKKAKEISIRKILGAGAASIVVMLGKDFMVLIIVAGIIASPLAFYGMTLWLQTFAYHIEIGWWMQPLSVLFAVVIAMLTICAQAIKAAVANPVKSLRTE